MADTTALGSGGSSARYSSTVDALLRGIGSWFARASNLRVGPVECQSPYRLLAASRRGTVSLAASQLCNPRLFTARTAISLPGTTPVSTALGAVTVIVRG